MIGILALLLPTLALAVPQSIASQGLVRTASGDPLMGPNDLTLSLYDDAAATNPAVYTITITDYPFVDGTYMVELPGLTPQALELADLYVGVAIGGASDMLPRTKLYSVPYALRAGVAETLADAGCADGETLVWDDGAGEWMCAVPAGAESDPVFSTSDASAISASDIAAWDTAASHGDHAGLYVENTAPAATIDNSDIASWNTAASHGDHAGLYVENTAPAATIDNSDIASWNAAASYGDPAGQYLPISGGTISGTTLDIVPPADGQDATLSFSGGAGDAADWAWVSSGEDLRLLEPEEGGEVYILIDDDNEIVFSPNGIEVMTMSQTGVVSTPSLIEQTCPTGTQFFGGYCVENLAGGDQNPPANFNVAMSTCASRGMMITPLRALAACDLMNTPGSCHNATDGAVGQLWTSEFGIGSDIFGRVLTYTSSANTSATASQTSTFRYLCATPAYVR